MKKGERQRNIVLVIRVNVRRLGLSALLCFTLNGQSKACNAICVLLLLQKAPQLHPSHMKLMTISQHVHEILMFSFTLFSSLVVSINSFLCNFFPPLSVVDA